MIGVFSFPVLGAIGGVLIGSIPGLTATMGIALLVPFTFGLDFLPGVAMLLGIFCGGMYGGSIAAILIHTPGTPAAAATVLDGYPMAQKGEAGRALSIALFASFCGGIIGALLMTFLAPPISTLALKFGPGEFFMLAMFGLSVIISISGKSLTKGLIMGVFYDGIPFIPALIGLFAVSEVIANFDHKIVKSNVKAARITHVWPSLDDQKRVAKAVVMGGLIGAFIGSIPGAGGDIAAFVNYSEQKRESKHPELFGTGVPEGVAASEAANNGCSGGAMIPMLSLGVPGDSNTAVLMGAFIIHGFQPGPMMYVEHLDIVYQVFAAMIVANIAFLIVGLLGIRLFAKVITIQRYFLIPCILLLSLVGAYAINQSMFDVFLCLVFGVLGYLFQRYGFPLSPILLALILGPMCEQNLRRYVQINDGFFSMFTRPICLIFFALALISLYSALRNQKKIKEREAEAEANAARADANREL